MTDAPQQSLDHATAVGPGTACALGTLAGEHMLMATCEGYTGPGLIKVALELSLDGQYWWDAPHMHFAFNYNGTRAVSTTQMQALHDVSLLARFARAVVPIYTAQAGSVSAWVEAL